VATKVHYTILLGYLYHQCRYLQSQRSTDAYKLRK